MKKKITGNFLIKDEKELKETNKKTTAMPYLGLGP